MPLLTRGRLLVLAFTSLYVLGAGVWFLSRGNTEFFWYILVMALIVGIVGMTLAKTQFPDWVLWFLSVWGLLHVMGGGVPVGGEVLYAALILPLYDGGGEFVLLKYDQIVHAFGFGVAALSTLSILSRSMQGVSTFWVGFTAALVSMGLSVINEIVEFAAVVFLSETGVGGYYNIGLDLVFNTLGAVVAVALFALVRRARA